MKIETYMILVPMGITGARDVCENYEGMVCDKVVDIILEMQDELDGKIEYYPLSRFMEMANRDKFRLADYYITYIQEVKRG